MNNIANGLNSFGCGFLYNRHTALQNKLNQLQSQGTNPLWQQMLQNRISYIHSLIMSNCTGGPTPGPGPGLPPKQIPTPPSGGSASPNQPMNASGGEYRNFAKPERHHLKPQKRTGQLTDEQIVRVSEVIGTWMN